MADFDARRPRSACCCADCDGCARAIAPANASVARSAPPAATPRAAHPRLDDSPIGCMVSDRLQTRTDARASYALSRRRCARLPVAFAAACLELRESEDPRSGSMPPHPVDRAADRAHRSATPIGDLPDVDVDAVLAHTKVLSSDRVRGPRARHEGRRADRRLSDRSVQEDRDRSPATPTGRTSRRCRSSASRRRRRRSIFRKGGDRAAADVERRCGGVDQARRRRRASIETPSWCSSATASWRPSTTGTTTRAST